MSINSEVSRLINANLCLMEDDVSRLIYLAQIHYRDSGDYIHIGKMLHSLWFQYRDSIASNNLKNAFKQNLHEIESMKPVLRFKTDNSTMFFDPSVISLKDDEVFCDCGALEMSTSLEFGFLTQDKFKKIYAFEPDSRCYEMCRDNLKMFSKEVRSRVIIYDYGLDEITGKLPFFKADIPGNSKTTKNGNAFISVKKLDDISECNDITFLKIHTEGNEFSVIKGASKLIKKNKPTIAVSLYHNLNELIHTPRLLHELVPEYKFFMRHYSVGTSESVLYAIRS